MAGCAGGLAPPRDSAAGAPLVDKAGRAGAPREGIPPLAGATPLWALIPPLAVPGAPRLAPKDPLDAPRLPREAPMVPLAADIPPLDIPPLQTATKKGMSL